LLVRLSKMGAADLPITFKRTAWTRPARKRLIEESTAILNKHAAGKVLTYVVIQEIPEVDWGMYGKQVDLSAMRAPGTA
jgi:phenylpyruvate tautomerase PptA (4-oxalocrotonate tautomerase family)